MAGTALRGRLTWQLAELVEVVAETPRVKTIVFDVPGWPSHRPGQHVDVRLTAEDGYQAERSYSIASAPGEPLAITVERLENGEVSPYLVEEARGRDLPAGARGSCRPRTRGLPHSDPRAAAGLDGLQPPHRQRSAARGRVAGGRAAARLHLRLDAIRRRGGRRSRKARVPAALDQNRTFRSDRWLTNGASTATRSEA